MDREGYKQYLQASGFTPDQAEAYAAFVEQFLAVCAAQGAHSLVDAFRPFARQMIAEKINTRENYRAIAWYGRFLKDNALTLAALELADGAEVLDNLYRKTGEVLGEARRNELFAGLTLAPVGTPNTEKPAALQPMLERLETADPQACSDILMSGLRNLPDEHYAEEKARFEQSASVDEYLSRKKRALMQELEGIMRAGALYFNQEITDEVLEYVWRDPEIGGGVRLGNIIYESKIPYQAREYLAEKDLDKKRYYYCHCPWVKESLRAGPSDVSPKFCNCSAAYMRKPWEVIFGRALQAEVLESVLKGDLRCPFAIHLPE